MSNELSKIHLKYLSEKRSYDPLGHYATQLDRSHSHRPALEDFLVNFKDEFEVHRHRRQYCRLTLPQLANFLLEDVEGLSDDD